MEEEVQDEQVKEEEDEKEEEEEEEEDEKEKEEAFLLGKQVLGTVVAFVNILPEVH